MDTFLPGSSSAISDAEHTARVANSNNGSLTWLQGLDDMFTGNASYNRQVELQNSAFDFERSMRDSSYSSMISQLKENGINPYVALQSGGASAGASAGVPSVGRSGKGWQMLANLAMSALSLATKTSTALETAQLKANTALDVASAQNVAKLAYGQDHSNAMRDVAHIYTGSRVARKSYTADDLNRQFSNLRYEDI